MDAGDVIDGRYRLLRLLGRGSLGRVFLAQVLGGDHLVAVKVVTRVTGSPETQWKRMQREFDALRRVDHPGVVEAMELGELSDGAWFLVTRYEEGPTLKALVDRRGPLGAELATAIGIALCDALAAAHEAGLVHRDVKPANVIVQLRGEGKPGPRARIVLLDFGLVWMRESSERERLTSSGIAVGTPAFMAPEQVRRESVDARTDVYAVGCLMLYLLTGTMPFARDSPVMTLNAQLVDAPSFPVDLDPGLRRVLEHFLAKEPAKRPADARAAATLLRTQKSSASWFDALLVWLRG